MSYEVTATRRRPQKFDDLVGQEFVAQTLKNSIKSGKIAHAYLFSGPRGCGKTSTARILAKALNCQSGPTDNPCGTCSNCIEITKGSNLDVIEIDGASNTSVDNIRQIKDEVLFPPSNSRYKIYIIDEVHMLSTSAFNALLKTIEEPPEYIIFIFATTELQKVPATIKSRCQQFNFRLVAIDKVKDCLADAAKELGIQADEEALFWIARESTGSMRDAYTLFDQVVAFSEGHITYDKIRDKLGLVGIDRLNAIFESCVNGQSEIVINYIDEFLQGGISIEQLISNCADYLRSLLLIKSGITKEALLGNSPDRFSPVVLNGWNTIQVERALSIFLQLYRDIRYSLSPRYELELTFSRLCWLSQYVSNVEVKKAIDAAQALLMGANPQAVANVSQMQNVQQNAVVNSNANAGFVQNVPVAPAVDVAPIPNGLPRLSMLDNPPPEDESEGEEQSHPFSNGGSLPPEQSVNNNQPVEPEAPKELDERLKIHIPQSNITSEGVVPTFMIQGSSTYTLNPDEDDSGWTNTDTPPEDNFYTEQYYTSAAENSYEATLQPVSSNQNGNIPASEVFSTPDGRNLSIDELKASVISNLSIKNTFVSAALEQSGKWTIKNDYVEAEISTSYNISVLQKDVPLISEMISTVCGKTMGFNMILKQQEEVKREAVELPNQVKILLDVFKGDIVAGKI